MSLISCVAASVLCAALASCAGAPDGSPAPGADGPRETGDGAPEAGWDLVGVIASTEPGPAATRVIVDAARPGTPGERVVLLVSPATEIVVRRADGTSRPGDVRDLAPGARVEARHTGAELRSLPPQYRVTHVRVLAGP